MFQTLLGQGRNKKVAKRIAAESILNRLRLITDSEASLEEENLIQVGYIFKRNVSYC